MRICSPNLIRLTWPRSVTRDTIDRVTPLFRLRKPLGIASEVRSKAQNVSGRVITIEGRAISSIRRMRSPLSPSQGGKMKFKFCALFIASLLLAGQGMAQIYQGRVEGLITDPSGAVIPGATVTLINVGTGLRQVRRSGPNGVYLFDLLNPGNYTITVEMSGFAKFVQENIRIQSSSDITVNVSMRPGAVQQTVTVTAAPSGLQLNTSNQNININTTLAQDTPRYDRNPFKLTLLAPEAVNTRGEMLPFLSWSANSVDLTADTNLKNNLLVDGSPVGLGHKFSYPPNMDDVQETTISQNGVDAEYGHSAGGVIRGPTQSMTGRQGPPFRRVRICLEGRSGIPLSRTSSSTSRRLKSGKWEIPPIL